MRLTILSASTSLSERNFKLEGKNSRLRDLSSFTKTDLWDWYSENEQLATGDILAECTGLLRGYLGTSSWGNH